jgi:hypothetical protein
MSAEAIQKRNKKSELLKVLQTEDGQYFVESGEGKILYKVIMDDSGTKCTCGDFVKNRKKDPQFACKHIISVWNAIPSKEVEGATFLEKGMPKLDDRFITNIKGKDFVVYAGVVDLATRIGLMKLEVEIIQFPTSENGKEDSEAKWYRCEKCKIQFPLPDYLFSQLNADIDDGIFFSCPKCEEPTILSSKDALENATEKDIQAWMQTRETKEKVFFKSFWEEAGV